jgi:hypothetical protein
LAVLHRRAPQTGMQNPAFCGHVFFSVHRDCIVSAASGSHGGVLGRWFGLSAARGLPLGLLARIFALGLVTLVSKAIGLPRFSTPYGRCLGILKWWGVCSWADCGLGTRCRIREEVSGATRSLELRYHERVNGD